MLSCFSRIQLFVTLWTAACQAPLSMGFSRQEYWSGLPCPPPGDLPSPGMEAVTHVSCVGRWVPYHWRRLGRGMLLVCHSVTPSLCDAVVSCSVVSDSVTPWTVACQTPLPMGFSRQGYWSGLPCPPPGDLPDSGIIPVSLPSPALAVSLLLVPPGKPKDETIVGEI